MKDAWKRIAAVAVAAWALLAGAGLAGETPPPPANRFGDDFYQKVQIADPEITPRRLDLAWEYMFKRRLFKQRPPGMWVNGSYYGICQLFPVPGTPLAVILGFVQQDPLEVGPENKIEIVYPGKMTSAPHVYVYWDDCGGVDFDYFDGSHDSEPPDAETLQYCRTLTAAVLDRCTAKDWRDDQHAVDKGRLMGLDVEMARGQTKPFARITKVTVNYDHWRDYHAALKTYCAESVAKEPGVVCMFPLEFASFIVRVVEVYRDGAAYLAHRETPHFRAFEAATTPMIRTIEREQFAPLATEDMGLIFKKAAAGGESMKTGAQ